MFASMYSNVCGMHLICTPHLMAILHEFLFLSCFLSRSRWPLTRTSLPHCIQWSPLGTRSLPCALTPSCLRLFSHTVQHNSPFLQPNVSQYLHDSHSVHSKSLRSVIFLDLSKALGLLNMSRRHEWMFCTSCFLYMHGT